MVLRRTEREAGAAWPGIVVGMFVAFGGILYGYDTGTISGILEMVGPRYLIQIGLRSKRLLT
jgi:hypothetical protein